MRTQEALWIRINTKITVNTLITVITLIIASTDGGIPIILVETASEQVRNGKTDSQYIYNQNTATESAVSGIIADYTNRRITVARVGRGVSRIVPLPN